MAKNKEFKSKIIGNDVVYVLESMTGGSTGASSGGTVVKAMGGVQRRKPGQNLIAQEADKDKIKVDQPTQRNPVAANSNAAIGGGAMGRHKNPKDAQKNFRKEKHKGSWKAMSMGEEQGVVEGEVVQFPKKHPYELLTKCPECGGPLQGGKDEKGRLKLCMPCMNIYRAPNQQGVAEGLPQTLRKVVPGYAKREIDKKMDAGKFGKTDADKDANFQRYKKIQDKIKEQVVAEGSDSYTVANNPDKPGMHSYREVGHAVQSGHSDAAKIYKNNKFLGTVGDVRKQGVAEAPHDQEATQKIFKSHDPESIKQWVSDAESQGWAVKSSRTLPSGQIKVIMVKRQGVAEAPHDDEVDYDDKYQAMVKRVGQKAREQQRHEPVDLVKLAQRLRQADKTTDTTDEDVMESRLSAMKRAGYDIL